MRSSRVRKGEGEGEGETCDRSVDGDCDGIVTALDCDDANPAALSNAPVLFGLQNAFARAPANVTLFFRATQCADDPIVNLGADAFTVRDARA